MMRELLKALLDLSRAPTVYTIVSLTSYLDKGECQAGLPDGSWVPARPLGFYSLRSRFNAAYLVFTGKADAVTWPGGQ